MVEDHQKQFWFPMLLKCHHVLHLVLKFETMENQPNDEFFCLDIFEMTIKTNELVPKSWQIRNYRYISEVPN
jgi:hypothetical protein